MGLVEWGCGVEAGAEWQLPLQVERGSKAQIRALDV